MIIKEQTKINLSAYFILPLLKLNINSYGKDNFINSFVTKQGNVVVHIKDSALAGDYFEHENMVADVEEDGHTMVVYEIPSLWTNSFNAFVNSKYSEMSKAAKNQIVAHAKANGLMYNQPTEVKGEMETSIIYHGLVKTQQFKESIEEQLGVKLSDEAELLSRLEEVEFIEL